MNIAQFFIERRVITLVLTIVLLGAGLLAYQGLSRLEDPEFTIKEALVITSYPGASAAEVEEEVSDRLEKAVQKMGQVKFIESKSDRGLSTLTVTIKNNYDKTTLPQVWDELRRKINDAQRELPPGTGRSLVIDDFGDVYGIFIAITGDGYSYAEIKDVVDLLRRELLLVPGVAKIDITRTDSGAAGDPLYANIDPGTINDPLYVSLGFGNRRVVFRLNSEAWGRGYNFSPWLTAFTVFVVWTIITMARIPADVGTAIRRTAMPPMAAGAVGIGGGRKSQNYY